VGCTVCGVLADRDNASMVHRTDVLPPQLRQRMQQDRLAARLRAGGKGVSIDRLRGAYRNRQRCRMNSCLLRQPDSMTLLTCTAYSHLVRDDQGVRNALCLQTQQLALTRCRGSLSARK